MSDRSVSLAVVPVAVGALVRAWAWGRWTAWPGAAVTILDPAFHRAWGAAMLDGTAPSEAWQVAPGPAVLFAAGQAAFGPGLPVAVAVALALDLAVVEAIRRLGARLSPEVGLVAGLAAAVAPPLVFHAVTLLAVAPAMLALAAALLLALGAADAPGWRGPARIAAAAALLVLGAWFRPNLLLLPPLVVLAGAWKADARGPAPRDFVRAGFAAVLGFALGLAPSLGRNVRVAGAWVPISANAGANLAMAQTVGLRANFPPPLAVAGNLKAMNAYFRDTATQALGHPASVVEADRWWRAEANRRMAEDPGGVVLRGLGRMALALSAIDLQDHYDYRSHRQDGTLPPGFDASAVLPALWIVGLGTAGRRRERWVFAATLIAVALSLAPFLVVERYRIVMDVARFPLAALGAVALAQGARAVLRREAPARRAAVAALGFVGLVALSHVDPFRGRLVVPDALAGWPGTLSRSALDGPRAADEASNLAGAFARSGAWSAAAPFHAKALSLQPDRWVEAVGLAQARVAGGDTDAGLAGLDAFVIAHPTAVDAAIGACSLALASDRPALAACERAVAAAPENDEARYQRAMALWQAGRLDEAAAALRAMADGPYRQRVVQALGRLLRESASSSPER